MLERPAREKEENLQGVLFWPASSRMKVSWTGTLLPTAFATMSCAQSHMKAFWPDFSDDLCVNSLRGSACAGPVLIL